MLRILRSDRGKTQTYEKECKLFETTQMKDMSGSLEVPIGIRRLNLGRSEFDSSDTRYVGVSAN